MTDNEKPTDTAQSEAEQVREAAAKVAEAPFDWKVGEAPHTYRGLANHIAAKIRAMPLPATTDKERVLRELLQEWWDESRRYIYDKTPERREKVIDRFKPRIEAALPTPTGDEA